MSTPNITKTWTISPNNRIVYVSINDVMAKYLFGVKAFLKSNGYTVAGSSNGSTGAMDGTDRWVTSANVTTRGAASANAQSWVVLTDGNGVQILMTYQGGSDDICRVSFSQGALFIAAGTPQNQPTATDEAVFTSSTSVIGGTASADRVWVGWVDATKKLCRIMVARLGLSVGVTWGVERVASVINAPMVVWSPPVWGFSIGGNSTTIQNATIAGLARVSIASIASTLSVFFGSESIANTSIPFNALQPLVTGGSGAGYAMFPLSIGATGTIPGKLANLVDWWQGRNVTTSAGAADGDLTAGRKFVGVGGLTGNGGGCLWPWDNTTIPVLL